MTAINPCESHVEHEPVYMLHVEPQENDSVLEEFSSGLMYAPLRQLTTSN